MAIPTARRVWFTVRKTLWFYCYIGQPTRWQTHWRKWAEFERALKETERW